MAESSIPVDVYNPGQVFSCLGFLEAADTLIGGAEGGFDWTDIFNAIFRLRTTGSTNPIEAVLEFLATTTPERWGPVGYRDPPPKIGKSAADAKEPGDDIDDEIIVESFGGVAGEELSLSETFPSPKGDRMSLPIRLARGSLQPIDVGHWADGSSRNAFKLYAGNRSAYGIACAMLLGVRTKPKKRQALGELRTKGIRQLWEERRDELIARPFDVVTPMGGSFNFDPRGAWTAIDAGYSPNDQGHKIEASPVVEFLAAWGLENARPDEFDTRKVRYAVWGVPLPPVLARAALGGRMSTVPLKHFRFDLDLSGKNKVVTFAELEMSNG